MRDTTSFDIYKQKRRKVVRNIASQISELAPLASVDWMSPTLDTLLSYMNQEILHERRKSKE